MKKILIWFIFWFSIFFIGSCGDNTFKTLEKSEPAEDAVKALEKQEPAKAIKYLLSALGSDYKSAYNAIPSSGDLTQSSADLNAEFESIKSSVSGAGNLVSILASAHAQLYGIDLLSLALALATEKKSGTSLASSSSANTLVLLFPVLPTPTTENIHGLQVSINILNSIGSSNFSDVDRYKQAILMTSSVSMLLKSIDSSGIGNFSTKDLNNITESTADALISQLESAAVAAAAVQTRSSTSRSATSTNNITAALAAIQSESGTTNADKLRNYLANKK